MTSRTSRWRSRAIAATIALGVAIGAVATGASSRANAASGNFVTAFQDSSGNLRFGNPAFPGVMNTGLGMAPGTSPVVKGLTGGNYVAAFQANTGHLCFYVTDTATVDTGLGMAPGTSPSISVHGNTYTAAFQANTGHLWLAGPGFAFDTGLAMAPATSPSIGSLDIGSGATAITRYSVVFHGANGDLWTDNPGSSSPVDAPPPSTPGTSADTGLAMAPSTSPSLTVEPANTGIPGQIVQQAIAFQASTGILEFKVRSSVINSGLGMAPGTSPSMDVLDDGSYFAAFQASNGHLWFTGQDGSVQTADAMAAGSSSGFSDLPGTGYVGAFADSLGDLEWAQSGLAPVSSFTGVAPGTSPSTTALS